MTKSAAIDAPLARLVRAFQYLSHLVRASSDPSSVLGRIQIDETSITDREVQALHQVIGQLSDYIRKALPTPEAIELVRHAKAVVGVTTK